MNNIQIRNQELLNSLKPPISEEGSTIFTPIDIIDTMIDLLPIWKNKNLEKPLKDYIFLNPCCKSGYFLDRIKEKLMEELKDEFPDEKVRETHILTKQIFGIATSNFTLRLTEKTLYGSKNIDRNIYLINWDKSNKLKKLKLPQELEGMKFDIIIGNPPYQEVVGGGDGSSALPIYHKFVEQAIGLEPKYITMIIPAKWYQSKRMKNFCNNIINDHHMEEIHDFNFSDYCFPNVSIGGGVCYFLWNSKYNGPCNFYEHIKDQYNNDKIVSYDKRFLKNDYFKGIIRYNNAFSILNKIIEGKINDVNFSNLITYGIHLTGLRTYFKDFIYQQDSDSIQLTVNANNKEKSKRKNNVFVKREKIKNHNQNYDLIENKYKIFISATYGGVGGKWPLKILSNNFNIGNPGSCCTETYLTIGGFDSLNITNNVISYMKTKFFRFLIMLKVVDKGFSPAYFTLIPLQNWDEEWTDEKLYKKYNLTQEEINFIESMITPM